MISTGHESSKYSSSVCKLSNINSVLSSMKGLSNLARFPFGLRFSDFGSSSCASIRTQGMPNDSELPCLLPRAREGLQTESFPFEVFQCKKGSITSVCFNC